MSRVFIELTEEQRAQLKPLFNSVRECNENKIHCAIGAQIFTDGIHAKVITSNRAAALAKELGGDINDVGYSAKQAFEDGLSRDLVEQGVKA